MPISSRSLQIHVIIKYVQHAILVCSITMIGTTLRMVRLAHSTALEDVHQAIMLKDAPFVLKIYVNIVSRLTDRVKNFQ